MSSGFYSLRLESSMDRVENSPWEGENPPPDFLVPLDLPYPDNLATVFENKNFLAGNLPTAKDNPLDATDRAWIVEKGKNPNTPTPPPSFAAQRALDAHLAKFDFIVPGSQDQWQSYIMYKYFELSLDPDPKISKPALDALAKTSVVGLSVDKQEISISNVTTEEVDKRLKEALQRYAGGAIESTAVRIS